MKACFLLLLFIPFAHGTTITPAVVIPPQAQVGEVIITNDTKAPQNYILSLDETTFPDENEQLLVKRTNVIKLSQSMLYLSPGGKQKIQLLSKDKRERERYFLLRVTEQITKKNQVYATEVTSRVFLRPANSSLKYRLEKNVIYNNSSGYIMLMLDKHCGKVEADTKLIKPGDSYLYSPLKKGDLLSIEYDGKVTTLVNTCE